LLQLVLSNTDSSLRSECHAVTIVSATPRRELTVDNDCLSALKIKVMRSHIRQVFGWDENPLQDQKSRRALKILKRRRS
jgi:hypothetical protein